MPNFPVDLDFGELRQDAFRRMVLDGEKIECKSDVAAFKYGNLAFEMLQRLRNGNVVVSGIAKDNYAILAHEIALDCWIVMPRWVAIAVAEKAIQRKWGGDNNNSYLHLIPMKDFFDILRTVTKPARKKDD